MLCVFAIGCCRAARKQQRCSALCPPSLRLSPHLRQQRLHMLPHRPPPPPPPPPAHLMMLWLLLLMLWHRSSPTVRSAERRWSNAMCGSRLLMPRSPSCPPIRFASAGTRVCVCLCVSVSVSLCLCLCLCLCTLLAAHWLWFAVTQTTAACGAAARLLLQCSCFASLRSLLVQRTDNCLQALQTSIAHKRA